VATPLSAICGLAVTELRQFIKDLISRLTRLAHPETLG
jgi:hypothetical protein